MLEPAGLVWPLTSRGTFTAGRYNLCTRSWGSDRENRKMKAMRKPRRKGAGREPGGVSFDTVRGVKPVPSTGR